MQADPVATALKFGFLAVLYLFLLWVARSAMRDLSRSEGGSVAADVPEPAHARRRERSGPDLRAGVRPRLEVVAAMGHEPGTRVVDELEALAAPRPEATGVYR